MKDNYKNILVALDGSDQSFEALKESVEIAKRNDAKLFLLTAIDLSPWSSDAQVMNYLLDSSKQSAKSILSQAEKLIPEKIEYLVNTVNGNPKGAIVQSAKANAIDLIIMGATGKTGLDKLLVGSTTAYVVNHAPCNVMVVR